jgi:hypothetical protein
MQSSHTPDGLASGPAAAAGNSLTENCNQINELRGTRNQPTAGMGDTANPPDLPRGTKEAHRSPRCSAECVHSLSSLQRTRDASCLAPPAQFRTCSFPAYGSHLGYKRQSNLAPTCRMRSSVCSTLTRRCVRHVLCQSAFPLVPALRSTDSAAAGSFTDGSVAERAALFAGFLATMPGRDFPRPYIIGYDSSSSRCGPSRSRNI